MFHKILVPVDGSAASNKAVDYAIEMAQLADAEIRILSVVPDITPTLHGALAGDLAMPDTTPVIEEIKEKLKGKDIKVHYEVRRGDIAEEILKCEKENGMDAVAMGNRGLSGLAELLLGSVSSKVVQLSKVPVVVLK